MKTSRIEEIVRAFREKWEGANTPTGTISSLMMDRIVDDYRTALTQAHQAGIDEVLTIIENRFEDKEMVNLIKKALQDNK